MKAGYLTYKEYDDLASQIVQDEEMPHTCVEYREVLLINRTMLAFQHYCYILRLDEELEALIAIDSGEEYCVSLDGGIILSGKF